MPALKILQSNMRILQETWAYDEYFNLRLCRCSMESTAQGSEWFSISQVWHEEPDAVGSKAATL